MGARYIPPLSHTHAYIRIRVSMTRLSRIISLSPGYPSLGSNYESQERGGCKVTVQLRRHYYQTYTNSVFKHAQTRDVQATNSNVRSAIWFFCEQTFLQDLFFDSSTETMRAELARVLEEIIDNQAQGRIQSADHRDQGKILPINKYALVCGASRCQRPKDRRAC